MAVGGSLVVLGLAKGKIAGEGTGAGIELDLDNVSDGLGGEALLTGGAAREHGKDVHNGVCAPGEDSEPAGKLDLALDGIVLLGILGALEANEQLVDDEDELRRDTIPAHDT